MSRRRCRKPPASSSRATWQTCCCTSSRTACSRSTSRTRSPRVPVSPTAARSSMSAPSRLCPRREQRAAERADLLRACCVRRHRGHLQSADDPPHAADVGHQRDPRHHPGRRDRDRGRCELAGEHRNRPRRGDPGGDQRRRRLRRDRPDARDVQGPPSRQDGREVGIQVNLAISLAYLLAAVLFILGLKQLSSPKGARNGNFTAAAGMVIALGATIPLLHFTKPGLESVAIGVVIGTVIGTVGARMVKMTAIPQMVALFNGVGGGAAALVAVAELLKFGTHPALAEALPSVFSIAIGSISFAGRMVAFAKLQELMTGTPITYPAQQIVNALLAAAVAGFAIAVLAIASIAFSFVALMVLGLVLGVAFVLPIGGADMPVVISMLNAFTALAVAASGFVLGNFALIVAGTLVGASGTLLTRLMSDAMGRSLGNVLFGAFGSVTAGPAGIAGAEGKSARSGTPEDIATLLAYSRKVIIVPGCGLAVAQGEHAVKELADELEKRGVEVEYAIHPVAGRMPGHMNVLLAEANVPYDQLKEMDQINDEFKSADVALVVGANDVVNPAARNSPGSPIYGMPILNADEAKNIVFMKRSMRPGFAGIDNELLYDPKTVMLFGDAKDSLMKLVAAVKAA